jgi:ribosomal protein S18 acetylase RimI-like enzyme
MDSFDDYLAPASRAAYETIPPPDSGKRWVPVRSLTSRHREPIAAHLLALDEHDRYLRFGYVASDAQIAHYVDQIDFDRDEVFGVFNRKLEVVAMAHLAYVGGTDDAPTRSAEFGVSVSVHLRGRRIGTRLFDHSMLHARNRGIDTLLIHALSENTPMIKIARHAGATVERSGGDSDAWLRLPPEDIASRLEALVVDGAAELDYSLKRRAFTPP